MTGGEPFVDSYTLYQAIFRPASRSQALKDFVLDSPQFAEIDGNVMVKHQLVTFITADIELRKAAAEYERLPRRVRFNRWSKIRAAKKKRLDELLGAATEAHDELEMLRKLAMPDNSLLMLKAPSL